MSDGEAPGESRAPAPITADELEAAFVAAPITAGWALAELSELLRNAKP